MSGLPPNLGYTKPLPQFWGRGYDGPPVTGTGSLAQQVGANRALAEFFQMMLGRRYDHLDQKFTARLQARNDARDQANSLERYQAQHAATMDESAYRALLKTDPNAIDWRSNPVFGDGSHVDGTNTSVGEIQGPALPGHQSASETYTPDPSLISDASKSNAEWSAAQKNPHPQQSSSDNGGGGGFLGGFTGALSDGLNFVQDNTPLGAIEDHAKDAGAKALDIISRPMYASANLAQEYFNLNKDAPQSVDAKKAVAGHDWFSFITGGKTGASVDEIAAHPWQSAKDLAGAYWDGLKGQDKTTFADVVKANASADNTDNVYDSPIMQQAVGFLGDVVYDPTSYIGGEVVSAPVKAVTKGAELATRTTKVKNLANELGTIMPSAADTTAAGMNISSDRYFKLLGGDFPAPRSSSERISQMQSVSRNVEGIINALHLTPIADKPRATAELNALGKALSARREQVISQFGGETLLDTLRHELEIKISKGDVPPTALSDLERTLNEHEVSKIIPSAREYERARQNNLRQVAKDFNIGTNREKGKSELDNLMKEYDRLQSIKNPSDKVKKKADALYKAIDKALNPEGQDIRQLLGDAFKYDLRFDNTDMSSLFKASEKLAYQDSTYVAQVGASRASQKNIEKINNYIRAAESKGDTKRVAELHTELEHALRRKGHADRIKDRVQAFYLIELMKKELAAQKGARYFSDPKFAKGVDDLLSNHIQPELAKINNGEIPNSIYTGVNGHDAPKELPTDFVSKDGTWDPSSLDPHPAFYDRVSHLKHMEQVLQRQLKSAEGTSKPVRKVVDNVPEDFLKDGKFSLPKLRSRVRFASTNGHTKAGVFSVIKTGNAETDKWLNEVTKVLTEAYDPRFRQILDGYESHIRKLEERAAETASKQNIGAKVTVKKNWEKRNEAIQAARKQASEEAFKTVGHLIEHNRLTISNYSTELPLRPVGQHSTEDELLQAIATKRGDEYAQALAKAHLDKHGKTVDELKQIDKQISDLKSSLKEAKIKDRELKKQAVEARKLMDRRLREDALLRVAAVKMATPGRAIKLSFLGQEMFNIPGSQAMFATAEKLGGVAGIKQIRQIWANAFKSPTSRLAHEKDLKLAYLRAMNNTPEIIALHVRELKDQFGHISEAERENTFHSWLRGDNVPTGDNEVQDAITKTFDELLPYFRGEVKVGGNPLTPNEINRYLPEDFQLHKDWRGSIDTPQQLIRAMSKDKIKSARSNLKDPYRVAWVTRIAIEQAMSRKGLEHTLNTAFGIPTGRLVGAAGSSRPVGKHLDEDTKQLLHKFRSLGWKTIPELGDTHYFPPELVHDIGQMMKLMEPRHITKFGNLVDKATGYWKTSVTVYNPGYYTRNGVGEVMSAWFGGVNDPEYYRRAMHVMRYVKHDGQDLQALKSHMPLLNLKAESQSERGRKVVGRLKNGHPITAEEAWVAYHDQGLKTGFFSTEFDAHYSRSADKLHQQAGEKLGGLHDSIRGRGERYEDYLRMAHFLHGMEHSGATTLKGAAEHAADQVRKYHFDYQDFTKFEKMFMLRAFPFYKWTRKAAPLMLTMMFTKPGKFLAYPKAMNSISNAVSTSDMTDNNGLAPNYEGIVPGWMQDMWAYKIAEGAGAAGAGIDAGTGDTYFNLATPQMDSLKSVTDPEGSFNQFLNPFLKLPLEQIQSQTFGGMQLPVSSPSERTDHLMRSTPQTSFVNKMMKSSDKGNALLSFLTGLGFYGNTKERQQGELGGNN